MAENIDIKTFYDSTFPTEKNLTEFSNQLKLNTTFTKETFLKTTNTAFAILGHFSNLDVSTPFDIAKIKSKYKPNVSTHALSTFSLALQKVKILNADFSFNPTAVPMIQRYDKIFSAYEKQNGITNPFAVGKEPGDN